MNRAEEMLRKHEQGDTYTALAKEYGITAQTCKDHCNKALERRELQVNEIYKALCYVNGDENRNVVRFICCVATGLLLQKIF